MWTLSSRPASPIILRNTPSAVGERQILPMQTKRILVISTFTFPRLGSYVALVLCTRAPDCGHIPSLAHQRPCPLAGRHRFHLTAQNHKSSRSAPSFGHRPANRSGRLLSGDQGNDIARSASEHL